MTVQQRHEALVSPLLDWYSRSARSLPWRENTDPYRIWVSEIMLQQTRVQAVIPYYYRFLAELPTIHDLAACPEEMLLKLWEGLGYYSRVRNMQKAARIAVEQYDGRLPADYEQLKKLPGIGEYTAGAIASIAFGMRCAAVDGNVLRVFSRLDANRSDIADPAAKKLLSAEITRIIPAECPGDFTQALMELGACVCLPNGEPLCSLCPLQAICEGFHLGIQTELPVKAAARAKKELSFTVLLLICGKAIALQRRPEKGVLAGMRQPVMIDGILSEQEILARLTSEGAQSCKFQPLGTYTHVFTHLRWKMAGWLVQTASPFGELEWTSFSSLQRDIALPAAFSPFLEKAGIGTNKVRTL